MTNTNCTRITAPMLLISTHHLPVPRALLAATLLLLAGAAGCSGVRLQPHPPVKLAPDLTTRGETVYFGNVFALDPGANQPTFVYERRVAPLDENQFLSAHITRDPSGAIVHADSVTHAADYELREYTLHTNQLGQTGSIHVDKDKVSFQLIDGDHDRTAVETARGVVVVGPTLVGYIVRNLDALRGGQVLPVRMAVLDRLETIGFSLSAVAGQQGQTRIEMKASSVLLAALIDPIHFTFDTPSGKLLRLEGRMPTKIQRGDRLHDFDARVEYRYVAAAYR